ncbi:MAG: PLDc N-terminal domain-containing protein [Halanaerobiaceae bacterium]
MFAELSVMEIIKMFLPIIILELGLKIYCIIQLTKKGARHFPDWVWGLIILIVSTFGPVAFLIFGRKRDY